MLRLPFGSCWTRVSIQHERVINRSLQECHPDYWKDREAAKAKQAEKRKERER